MMEAILGADLEKKAVDEVVADYRRRNGGPPAGMETSVRKSCEGMVERAYAAALQMQRDSFKEQLPAFAQPPIPSDLNAEDRAELEDLVRKMRHEDIESSARRHERYLAALRSLIISLFLQIGVTKETANMIASTVLPTR